MALLHAVVCLETLWKCTVSRKLTLQNTGVYTGIWLHERSSESSESQAFVQSDAADDALEILYIQQYTSDISLLIQTDAYRHKVVC